MNSSRIITAFLMVVAGCSSAIPETPDTRHERLASQTSALASNANTYRIAPPPSTAQWLVLLCYLPGQSPGDTTFYTNLFTKAGAPGNIWDYWNSQSNGGFSNDIQVLGWFQTTSPANGAQALLDCVNASGINPANYFNVVTMFAGLPDQNVDEQSIPTSLGFQCNQNGGCEGQVIADADSPPAGILHEMGHGMSLDHSFDDTSNIYCGGPGEYGDNWDIMSFNCSVQSFNGRYRTPGPNGGSSQMGPGLNLWERYKLGWLSNSQRAEFWPQSVNANIISASSSLTSRSLVGTSQMLSVPATSTYEYLVEYASANGFDQGITPVLLVHRHYYGDDHSYIVKSLPNAFQTSPGNPFQDTTAGVAIGLDSFSSDLSLANFTVTIDTNVSTVWQGSTTGQPPGTPWTITWAGANVMAGDLVAGALQVGTDADNSPLYVRRAWYYGEQLGKVTHGLCAFPWGGSEHWASNFAYLVTTNIPGTASHQQGDPFPSDAIPGGFENGTPEYVCEELIGHGDGTSSWMPGKTVSWGQCDVSYGGNEVFASSYNILTVDN